MSFIENCVIWKDEFDSNDGRPSGSSFIRLFLLPYNFSLISPKCVGACLDVGSESGRSLLQQSRFRVEFGLFLVKTEFLEDLTNICIKEDSLNKLLRAATFTKEPNFANFANFYNCYNFPNDENSISSEINLKIGDIKNSEGIWFKDFLNQSLKENPMINELELLDSELLKLRELSFERNSGKNLEFCMIVELDSFELLGGGEQNGLRKFKILEKSKKMVEKEHEVEYDDDDDEEESDDESQSKIVELPWLLDTFENFSLSDELTFIQKISYTKEQGYFENKNSKYKVAAVYVMQQDRNDQNDQKQIFSYQIIDFIIIAANSTHISTNRHVNYKDLPDEFIINSSTSVCTNLLNCFNAVEFWEEDKNLDESKMTPQMVMALIDDMEYHKITFV